MTTQTGSLGSQRTACAPRDATGPTPIHSHVNRELRRIANVWGTREFGWTCRFDAAGCVLSAYVGKPSCIVAVAHHVDSAVLRSGSAVMLNAGTRVTIVRTHGQYTVVQVRGLLAPVLSSELAPC